MTGIEKVLLALGVVAVGAAGVGIGLAASKSQAPSPAPSPSPSPAPPGAGGGGLLWVRATTINPGDRVRVSVSANDLQTLATSLGLSASSAGPNALGALWQQVLASSQLQSVIQAGAVQAWWPAGTTPTASNPAGFAPSPLPTDWPSDDPSASSEYHAQFTYGSTPPQFGVTPPLLVANLPIPVLAWVAKGTGA